VELFYMKINRHGQSKILTPEEIELLFSQGLQTERDRVCLASAFFPRAALPKLAPLSPAMSTA
jgi:integrase/recombinase XerD